MTPSAHFIPHPERLAKLILVVLSLTWITATRADDASFLALCFHDVRSAHEHPLSDDTMTVNTTELVAQLDWLRGQGYQPVRIADILAAKAGKKPLPNKAVLLTFDDGYQSFFHRVYPLLQLYQYPAVVGLVTSWMEKAPHDSVTSSTTPIPRQALLTWDQVRTMLRSGLVEVASHSHDLHHGIVANPQGNTQPAAATRLYDATAQRYESDEHYQTRIRHDVLQSIAVIERETGIKPPALIWPFGSFTADSVRIAQELGLPLTIGLSDGHNHLADTSAIKRLLIREQASLNDLVWTLQRIEQPEPRRAVFVRLDDIYDPDTAEQERKLGEMLDRINQLHINTVMMLSLADPDRKGMYHATYFANDELRMRADLLNRAAWQIRTRTRAKAYAWVPLSGLTKAVDVNNLYGALAKHVDISGVVIDLGALPAPRPTAMAIDTLIKRMKQHRPELTSIIMTDTAITDHLLNDTLPDEVRNIFAVADMALLSLPSQWQRDATLDKFAAQLATLPLGRSRSMVALPPRSGHTHRLITPELALHGARSLLARGIKHLAFADESFVRRDEALVAAKHSISLASRP